MGVRLPFCAYADIKVVNIYVSFNGMDMFKEENMGDYQKKLCNGAHQEEENEVDLNLPGRKGLGDWWEKRE